MSDEESVEERIFEAVQSLTHTDIIYFFGDLCAMNGWSPRVTVGEPETTGDLVATRTIPYPESITFLYYDQGVMRRPELERLVSESDTQKIVILVDEPPEGDLIEESNFEGFAFLGLGDLTAEVSRTRAIKSLLSYLPEEGELYEGLSWFLTSGQPPSKTSGAATESSSQTGSGRFKRSSAEISFREDEIGTKGEVFGFAYGGHQHVKVADEYGILCVLHVLAGSFDLEIRPDDFTARTGDALAFNGHSRYNSTIINEISGDLEQPWLTDGRAENVPGGGKKKMLLFFPTGQSGQLENIRYSAKAKRLIDLSFAQVEGITRFDKNEAISLDLDIPERSPLPASISELLERIYDPDDPDPIEGTMLADDAIGVDMKSWDVEIEAWEYYRSTGEYDYHVELQDGVMISLEVTPKVNSRVFRSRMLRIRDSEDQEIEPDKASHVMSLLDYNNLLMPPWMWEFEGNVSLPNKGTSVKILQHVPSEAPISVSEIGIRVRDDEIYIEPPEQKWNSIRGLPDHLDVALAKIGMEA